MQLEDQTDSEYEMIYEELINLLNQTHSFRPHKFVIIFTIPVLWVVFIVDVLIISKSYFIVCRPISNWQV